jgi:hypothetical protein
MQETVTITCCMPIQHVTIEEKLEWLDRALGQSDCDLFLTPQEWLGGHYVWQLAKQQGKEYPLHVDRGWVVAMVGALAKRHRKHIAVGACCKATGQGASEDLLYIDDDGKLLGYHSKYALPGYDDVRTKGHGKLWPEVDYKKRMTPIQAPKLGLRMGSIFCWEVHSQMLWGAYSMQGVNLVNHVVKFAPRGWLNNKVLADGQKHIVGFGNEPKSQIWRDRLIMAGRHQVLCPIAVSCNSWDLGEKMLALVGHVDELKRDRQGRPATDLRDIPSRGDEEYLHSFTMSPRWYEGLDHHHSMGAFKAHTGTVEGFHQMGEWTMHGKIRRLEAHLIGDTTRFDCIMKAITLERQKKSIAKRLGGGPHNPTRRKAKPPSGNS